MIVHHFPREQETTEKRYSSCERNLPIPPESSMFRISVRILVILFLLTSLVISADATDEVVLPDDVQGCVSCHINPGMEMSFRDEAGQLRNLHINPVGFVHSIHFRNGQQSCYDCHEGDFSQFPHRITAELPQCLDCHDEIRDEYVAIDEMTRTSVHFGETLAGFDCATCHSPHEMIPAREMTLEQKNAACLQCHEGNNSDSPLPSQQASRLAPPGSSSPGPDYLHFLPYRTRR